MLNPRSPKFLLTLGLGLGALTLGSGLVFGLTLPTLLLCCLCLGPILEEGNWESVTRFTALFYDIDTPILEAEVYQPFGALVRSASVSIFLLLVGGVGAGGLNVIPDGFVSVLLILGPAAIYSIVVILTYRHAFRSAAKRLGWARRTAE